MKEIQLLDAGSLEKLIQEQRETSKKRKELTREMKAARKKRTRVLKRVDLLTVDDLKAVIQERLETAQKANDIRPTTTTAIEASGSGEDSGAHEKEKQLDETAD